MNTVEPYMMLPVWPLGPDEIDKARQAAERKKREVEAEICKRVRGLAVFVTASTDPWHVEVRLTDDHWNVAGTFSLELAAREDAAHYYDSFVISLIRRFALDVFYVPEGKRAA